MYHMKSDMRSLFSKVYMKEDNDLGEMQNFSPEIYTKQFKEIIASK